MIDSPNLLSTLKGQLTDLLADLHRQVDTVPEIDEQLRREYQRAFDAERTGWTFTEWAEDRLTQVAVGWLLGCVFVRYCEHNGLIDDPMIAGAGEAATLARAAQQDYFRAHPTDSDREYLYHVFRRAAALVASGSDITETTETAEGLADLTFVAVGGGGVDVAVAGLERGADSCGGLGGWCLEHAEPDDGDLDAVVEREVGDGGIAHRGHPRLGGVAAIVARTSFPIGEPARKTPGVGGALHPPEPGGAERVRVIGRPGTGVLRGPT